MKPILTQELARAVGADAANRSMRKDGRKEWNSNDYNIAVGVYMRLMETKGEAS